MHLRSSINLAILSGILASSAFAAAPSKIVVYNNTVFSSTVRVTSGQLAGKCVGDKLYTKPGESKSIPWNSINLLCNGKFPCKADVFVGDSHDCGDKAGSSDVKAGSVGLASDGTITVTAQISNYHLIGGAAELTVSQ